MDRYFDTNEKTLYLRLPEDQNPNSSGIRVKTQTYALSISNSNNLTVEGIKFFGTTLKISNSDYITIKNCDFLYPSCYKRALGEINSGQIIENLPTFTDMTYVTSSQNCTYGCTFKHCDGSVLEIEDKILLKTATNRGNMLPIYHQL